MDLCVFEAVYNLENEIPFKDNPLNGQFYAAW